VFLLVLAHPSSPGQRAVKRLLLLYCGGNNLDQIHAEDEDDFSLACITTTTMNTQYEFRNVLVTEAVLVTDWPCTESRPELETK